jgi:signal transduction histidine kinase
VRLSAECGDGRADIRIADDGPGVVADESEAIFLPGRRRSAAAGEGGGEGAGLGLALARRLARAAGGDVRAEPSAEGGSFVITLPLAADDETQG